MKYRVANAAGFCPFTERYFGNQFRFDPMCFSVDVGFLGKWALCTRNRDQFLFDVCQGFIVKAGSHIATVLQLPLFVVDAE